MVGGEGDGGSPRFRELLVSLASEHENEVRRLRAEVARLREDRGEEDKVDERGYSQVSNNQYSAVQEFRTWLPLCNGCTDGDRMHTFEAYYDEGDNRTSQRDMSVVLAEPVLSRGSWASEANKRRSQWATQTNRWNGSATASQNSLQGRLVMGSGVPWDASGDVDNLPQWKDPTQIARELENVGEDELDRGDETTKEGARAGFTRTKKRLSALDPRRSSRLSDAATSHASSDADSVLSDSASQKVMDATPMECWQMFVDFARGHAQCKFCWLEAVAHWKRTQQTGLSSLELGKVITVLVPRNGGGASGTGDGLGEVTRPASAALISPGGRTTDMVRNHTGTSLGGDHTCFRLEALVSHPNSRKRILWDMLGVLLLMHDLVMLPMSVFEDGTNGLGNTYKSFQQEFDLVSSTFWTSDMFVSFLTGYFTNEGFTEVRIRRVILHYMKSWFSLDLFIVTVDWVSFFFNGLGTTSNFLRLGKTVSRSMRALRLLRFMKLNTTLRDLLAMINSEYVLTLVNLLKILFGMVLLSHYLACIWYLLSYSIFDDEELPFETWYNHNLRVLQGLEPGDKPRVSYAYATALHWSLTQFTPASMEVTPKNELERSFNIVVIIFALVIFSSFVSQITQAMTHIRNINSARTAREGEIRVFLSTNKISHKLASRIWRCVRANNTVALGQQRRRVEDIPLLRMLPEHVKEELRQEVFLPVLMHHPLFREYFMFDPDVVVIFCATAVSEASLKSGEHAISDWKCVKELIFVVDGTLEYHWIGCEEPLLITRGQWACESALWATAAALDGPIIAKSPGAEIMKVSADGIQKVAENHPSSCDFLGRYARQFIHKFNAALLEDTDRPLFNDFEPLDNIAHVVLRQCGKARGISGKRRRLSDRPTQSHMSGQSGSGSSHEAKHIFGLQHRHNSPGG